MVRLPLTGLICILALALPTTIVNGQQNQRNALLEAQLQLLGPQILPFTAAKQQSVVTGVVNVLEDGILATDINLTVLQTYQGASTGAQGRRLLQSNSSNLPGVEVLLNISTSAGLAAQSALTLSRSINVTYQLASDIGAAGLQTQAMYLVSTDVVNLTAAAPPASQSSTPQPGGTAKAAPSGGIQLPSGSGTPQPAAAPGNSTLASYSKLAGPEGKQAVIPMCFTSVDISPIDAAPVRRAQEQGRALVWRARRKRSAQRREEEHVASYMAAVAQPAVQVDEQPAVRRSLESSGRDMVRNPMLPPLAGGQTALGGTTANPLQSYTSLSGNQAEAARASPRSSRKSPRVSSDGVSRPSSARSARSRREEGGENLL